MCYFNVKVDLFLYVNELVDDLINAGVEARGFIFGPPIALAIGAKFVPMRKPKKLPGIFFFPLVACYFNIELHQKSQLALSLQLLSSRKLTFISLCL